MRHFNILSITIAATVALSACSMGEENMYIGSRDDIVVSNKNMPKEMATNKIETVKEAAQEAAQAQVTQAAEAIQEPQIIQPMDTPVMKSALTTQTTAAPAMASGNNDVPPNAKPGECYAKVLIPAVKENVTKRIQVSEEQKVLARIIPAQYRVETEQILVREARQYWKPGTGPVTRKDEITGDIMCLVEEPAQYKTIEKRVLVTPEQPEYKLVPAQFETITKTNVIQAERWEWRRILCETNMGQNSVMRIQQALRAKGYNIAIDGRLGSETMDALSSYQRKNGLATQGITYETLESLGVQLIGA